MGLGLRFGFWLRFMFIFMFWFRFRQTFTHGEIDLHMWRDRRSNHVSISSSRPYIFIRRLVPNILSMGTFLFCEYAVNMATWRTCPFSCRSGFDVQRVVNFLKPGHLKHVPLRRTRMKIYSHLGRMGTFLFRHLSWFFVSNLSARRGCNEPQNVQHEMPHENMQSTLRLEELVHFLVVLVSTSNAL